MKIRNIISFVFGILVYFFLKDIILSYDNFNSHPSFNEAIVTYFEQNYRKYFSENYTFNLLNDKQLFTGTAVTDPGKTLADYGTSKVDYTALEWIKHGGFSADEPELAASVRHFYDPIGLNGGKKYLTNRGTYWEWAYPNPHIDAIEWAIGDTPKGEDNHWSLYWGKGFVDNVFSIKDEDMKNANIARSFRCIGEVLHNTADMGCPPHTRNDSHAAPWGYNLGFILGSPDPYEEMFNHQWISRFMNSEPDPDFKSFCDNSTKIRSINEKLAEFSNTNFFTEQTINGMGGYEILPINNEGNYPHPLLQQLEYDAINYTYYKTFPSGRKIKMAKDEGYFWKRTYPYIDRDCVESQASELVPNIVYAGANVLRLFFPQFEIKINSANLEEGISGIITHLPSEEYSQIIYYFGKVDIYDAEKEEKIGELDCDLSEFNGKILELNNVNQIYAEIKKGPIEIRSDIYDLDEPATPQFTRAFVSVWYLGLTRTRVYDSLTVTKKDTSGFSTSWSQHAVSYQDIGKGNLLDNSFISNWDFEWSSTNYSGNMEITFNEEFSLITSIKVMHKEEWSSGWDDWETELVNIPQISYGVYKFIEGEGTCANIVSLSASGEGGTPGVGAYKTSLTGYECLNDAWGYSSRDSYIEVIMW